MNKTIRETLERNTIKQYASSAKQDIASSDVLSVKDIRRAVKVLRKNRIKPKRRFSLKFPFVHKYYQI